MKRSHIISILLVFALAALVVVALWPSPIKVEASRATRGPLRVTIDEEGEARAHDRFVIAAPVAGRLARVELHDGDKVARGEVVAVITPSPLDPRQREEVIARVQSAEALKREADARVECALANHEQARLERERAEKLAKDGLVSMQSLEQAKNAEITTATEIEAARFKAQAAASEVKLARAGLMSIDAEQKAAAETVRLRSPVGGRVLQVIEKSERVVAVGAPIITLGDPDKIEIVVDVLSTDAVKVRPGALVLLEDWGGEVPLRARVRTVECSAFTKVSALGIEEQRVNIVADFLDLPAALGDGYRVEARIIIWESSDALKVPSSALFRQGDKWSVFLIEEGKARRREVEVGHRSQFEAEILSGIEEGAEIILHPSNQIEDGASVETR
jgi:HlyD family secretion protein